MAQEAMAVLSQLREYVWQALDERSFAALLADLTHLRIRLERSRDLPAGVAHALQALDSGPAQALSELQRDHTSAAEANSPGSDAE
jgi:hypothetical protein